MGLLDGWPFRSKEETERRNKEFNDRVMPLGEAQKDMATDVLVELRPENSKTDGKELLFAYLVAKDKYILKGKGEDGMEAMSSALKKIRFLSEDEQRIVKALVKYDSEVIDIKYYPTAQKIRTAIDKGFV